MRVCACLLLLVAASAAQAQMYKCVDASGKTRYADKPIADCRNARTITAPAPPPAAKAAASGKVAVPARRPLSAAEAEHERKFAVSRCRTLKEEEEWLLSPRGAGIESHAARLGQVRQALAACS